MVLLNDGHFNKTFGVEAFAYADDIVIKVQGWIGLHTVIDELQEWCQTNEIEINRSKSGILEVRKDKRTPITKATVLKGIPIVTEYKYLGVMVDDCLNTVPERQKKNKKLLGLSKSYWMLMSNRMNGTTRYHIWVSLF